MLAVLGFLGGCAFQDGTASASSRATQSPIALVPAEASGNLVTRAQALLAELGYRPGPADGIVGPRTTAAVRAYQSQAGLTEDGRVTARMVDRLSAAVEARRVAAAQRHLAELGYDPGPVDGRPGPRTRSAVEAFQNTASLPLDGEVSPDLLAALEAALGAAAPAAAGQGEGQGAAGARAEAQAPDRTDEIAALPPETRLLVPGDMIQLRYLGAASSAVDLRIGGDGALSLPERGPIQAAGLRLDELRDRITVSLIEDYMQDLTVDVVRLWAAGDVQSRIGEDGVARLGPGDVVRVKASGERIGPANIEIARDGSLPVPAAGSVMAGGLTVDELEAEIKIRLVEGYMDKLDVAVDLVEQG